MRLKIWSFKFHRTKSTRENTKINTLQNFPLYWIYNLLCPHALKLCLQSSPVRLPHAHSVAHHNGMFQLATRCAEAVENVVLSHAVDPLSSRREHTGNKVSTLPLPRTEATHNLECQRNKELKTLKLFSLTINFANHIYLALCSWYYIHNKLFVSGFEKRAHFAQNA